MVEQGGHVERGNDTLHIYPPNAIKYIKLEAYRLRYTGLICFKLF